MQTELEQEILETVRRWRMIVPGDRVAVAVSGGADSIALLRLLDGLRNKLGITLLVAHFDHGLRGSESEADARFVQALAVECGLECICDRGDVRGAAAREHLNLEDAARRLRYEFLRSLTARAGATRVAVAHTADDQAETVLARLLRGTGFDGLASIHPVVGPIVRPLVATRREELRAYLRAAGQLWREDESNLDRRRQRARIRAELMPVLEGEFSPRIVEHLCNLARFSQGERSFWAALVEELLEKVAIESDRKYRVQIADLFCPMRAFSGLSSIGGDASRPLTERLIRRLYQCARGDVRDLSARHVEQVIRLATESPSGRHLELPHGVFVEREFGALVFYLATRRAGAAETEPRASTYQYVVALPTKGVATISIPELGSRFFLKVIDWSSVERDTTDDDALDADLLGSKLTFRNWQAGDGYRPRGYRHSRKLKQLFVAHHVPRGERADWPVLECRDRIVWARGMPPAEEFCARESTKTGVLIEEWRSES
jgi:tRNA(Ile)-lysidine synthase